MIRTFICFVAVAMAVVAAEPTVAPEPTVVAEPAAVAEPTAIAEPAVAAEPTAIAEPAVAAEPTAIAEPVAVAEPTIATDSTVLAPGGSVTANSRTTISVAGIPGSAVTLAPGSALSATTAADGALVLDLARGQIELNLPGHGSYPTVQVDAAYAHVTVTGTIFQVERGERRDDFVALIAGKLTVTHRRAVAKALSERGEDQIELTSRQGVAVGPNGLGSVVRLQAQPRLAEPSSLLEQALAGLGLGFAPMSGTDGAVGTTPEDLTAALSAETTAAVTAAVTTAVEEAIAGSISAMIEAEVVDAVLGGSSGPGSLGSPPPPPAGF